MSDHSLEKSDAPVAVAINNLPLNPQALKAEEVHVWIAPLLFDLAEDFSSVLSSEEVARANQFLFVRDKNNFIVARGLLRKLLASYLNIGAEELHFVYGAMGKPSIEANSSLNFNLAHSHEIGVYAFSLQRQLGVDIEYLRREVEEQDIARRFFSPKESTALEALPRHLRKEAFFNCWTRKEAYIKARGQAIPSMLDTFEVSLAPGEPAALVNHHTESEVSRWSMQSIPVPSGYVAALVVEGHDWLLKTYSVEYA